MDATTVMDRLRTSTLADHKAAESHPFQQALAQGTLPRELFVRNLSQLLHVHRALDAALAAASATCPAIAAVVRGEQFQSPYLEADLAFFEYAYASDPPLPPTAALVSTITRTAATDPIALLGLHYVLEGSNNGSKFLSRVVQRAYGLPPGGGTLYMDPYGDRQRDVWAQFKRDMDAAGITEDEASRLVVAAQAMFRAIGDIGSAVMQTAPAGRPGAATR